ncbi:MAG: VCBS repeat-containing protein, partial [Bdellovibrionales bacterium]|nr:VCBS repeat-containing protein [Bdellovibrionales bacterium]
MNRRIHQRQRRNDLPRERGFSLISLAVVLSVVLVISLAAIDLFFIFRAAIVVERAAAEAAQAAAMAEPGGDDYKKYTLPAVANKVLPSSTTGGNTEETLDDSMAAHGVVFYPADKVIDRVDVEHGPPFSLSRRHSVSPSLDIGVQYLPMVTAYNCIEPINESGQRGDSGCAKSNLLTYQLPSKIDFDGDGHEDIAFYYAQTSGSDWWILPSSSGSLFEKAITMNYAAVNATSRAGWLPCPGDYDGDGKTDFCVVGRTNDTAEFAVGMKLSSSFYYSEIRTSLGISGLTRRVLPVPGRWNAASSKDQFAIILSEGTSQANHLAVMVYPEITKTNALDGIYQTFSLNTGGATTYGPEWKPPPGKNWRPVFGDHDGDGDVDIGWLHWAGGNPTWHLAGSGVGVQGTSPTTAVRALMTPFALHYPRTTDSPGLYVVERFNHRISLITKGVNSIVDGTEGADDADEQYVIIAGSLTEDAVVQTTFPTPDPLSQGVLDSSPVPLSSVDASGCATCAPHGGFGGDGGLAISASLNSPRDVFTEGTAGAPLFIADYGNYRVRKVSGPDGNTDYIDGSNDEVISTIAGGTVAAG